MLPVMVVAGLLVWFPRLMSLHHWPSIPFETLGVGGGWVGAYTLVAWLTPFNHWPRIPAEGGEGDGDGEKTVVLGESFGGMLGLRLGQLR